MKSPTKSNVLKPNCSKKPTFEITSVSPVSILSTGKSLSEALIFASTNPQYDNRLFIELHENSKLKPGDNMLCTEIVSDIHNNFCTQHVLPMFCKKKSF